METKETYEITLVPIVDESRVTFEGKDYTTSARKNRVTLNGKSYYVRQNGEREIGTKLRDAISGSLESIFQKLGEVNEPIIISISRLEQE